MRSGMRRVRGPSLTFRPNLELLEDRITPVLLGNGIPTGAVSAFSVDVGDGGEITTTGSSMFTFGGQVTNPYSSKAIYQYSTYVAVGGKGGAFDLSATTITQPATLINGEVVSEGYFTGDTRQQINWVSTDSLMQFHGKEQLMDQLIFATTGGLGLGSLSVIQYLDEDTSSAVTADLLVPQNVGTSNLMLSTMNAKELVGLAQGGSTQIGQYQQNATFLGWAADSYPHLVNAITGPGAKYAIGGMVNSDNLPVSYSPQLQQAVYGPNDVTTALAWSVIPTSTAAVVTPFLIDVPTPVPTIATSLPNMTVGQPFSTTLSTTGPAAPAEFGLASSSLPPGLRLNPSTGLIQGTPSVAGTFPFTLVVVDVGGMVGMRNYQVTVSEPATSLQFVQQPGSTQAGVNFGPSLAVQLYRNGTPLAAAGDTIRLALTSGTGVVLGTTSAVTDASGLATFSNLQINNSGTKILRASTWNNVSASSMPFSITPASASLLGFVQQPTLSKPGQTMTPVTVQLEDSYGNPVSLANVPITLSATAGSSPLLGTLTQFTNVFGQATFSNLQMSTSGRQQLQASSAGFQSALSGAFNVGGPATGFVFTLHRSVLQNRVYVFTVQAVDALGDPALAPSNLLYPSLTIQTRGAYVLTPIARSADGTSWTYLLVSRTLGSAQVRFQALFDYPAALGGNRVATSLLSFTTTF